MTTATRHWSADSIVPVPPDMVADAVVFAKRLVEGVEQRGVRLRRVELAAARLIAADGAPSWAGVRLIVRLARHHLADPAA